MNEYEFTALFGSIEEVKKAAAVRPEPTALPWEDSSVEVMTKWLRPPTLASTVEQDALAKDILGGELPKVPAVETESLFAAPRTLDSLVKFADKLSRAWDSKKHRVAVTAILQPLLVALKFKSTPDNDAALERLTSNMVNHCCQQVFEAAGDELA
jgi:hypothetical protein